MRKALLALTLCFGTIFFCKADESVVLVFEKNKAGEVVARLQGHKVPIIFKINDQTVTVYPEDGVVNLSAMGIETLLLSLRTDSGADKAIDNNAVPPVNPLLNPNPSLSTPF